MKSFRAFLQSLGEDFNVFPRAKATQRGSVLSPGPNINFTGPLPAGFKGAGAPGIAPGAETPIKLRLPKNKKIIKKSRTS